MFEAEGQSFIEITIANISDKLSPKRNHIHCSRFIKD